MIKKARGHITLRKSLKIPVTAGARKYGYLYWKRVHDEAIEAFLCGAKAVDIVFDKTSLGEKTVDYRYRRISLGWANTRPLPEEVSQFRLAFQDDGRLRITCN